MKAKNPTALQLGTLICRLLRRHDMRGAAPFRICIRCSWRESTTSTPVRIVGAGPGASPRVPPMTNKRARQNEKKEKK